MIVCYTFEHLRALLAIIVFSSSKYIIEVSINSINYYYFEKCHQSIQYSFLKYDLYMYSRYIILSFQHVIIFVVHGGSTPCKYAPGMCVCVCAECWPIVTFSWWTRRWATADNGGGIGENYSGIKAHLSFSLFQSI